MCAVTQRVRVGTWGDDARHSVKVEVRRPGLEVRSRGDYLDSSRRAEVSMAVESALLFGSGATSDGVLRVAVGNAARSRVSSLTRPSAIGTLKSTRTSAV